MLLYYSYAAHFFSILRPSSLGFTERRLALANQVEMAYLDNGGGGDHPPLVLLHGIFDNKATWFRLTARLPDHRIIAP